MAKVSIFVCILILNQLQYHLTSATRIQRRARTVIDSPTMSSVSLVDCDGSLVFDTEKGRVNVSGSLDKTKILFHSVKMTGCGCFSIHSGKNGKGAVLYISANSGKLTKAEIGMGRIRSIRRYVHNCPVKH